MLALSCYSSYMFKDFIKLILAMLVKNQWGILGTTGSKISYFPISAMKQDSRIWNGGAGKMEIRHKRGIEREGDWFAATEPPDNGKCQVLHQGGMSWVCTDLQGGTKQHWVKCKAQVKESCYSHFTWHQWHCSWSTTATPVEVGWVEGRAGLAQGFQGVLIMTCCGLSPAKRMLRAM